MPPVNPPYYVHGTAIAINGHGILLQGRSGCGKSDLALRLIDRGAQLVSDDRVGITTQNYRPVMIQAPNIGGKIEIHGLGIFAYPAIAMSPLWLLILLDQPTERMPYLWQRGDICGFSVPRLALNPFETSAAIKVEQAIKAVVDGNAVPVALSELNE